MTKNRCPYCGQIFTASDICEFVKNAYADYCEIYFRCSKCDMLIYIESEKCDAVGGILELIFGLASDYDKL